MTSLNLFIPITKVDEAKRLVYGTLSEETPDKSGEILDYESAKPAFQKWSDDQHKASEGKSRGNLRAMHDNIAAGKFTDISFDDEGRRIQGVAKVVDDDSWNKVLEGVFTGFSIGGGYAKRWKDPDNPSLQRYTPELAEVSLVDNPCVPTATFEFIKEDGSTELRKFNHKELIMTHTTEAATETDAKPRPQDNGGVTQGFMAKDGSFHVKKAAALARNDQVDAEAVAAPALDMMRKIDDAVAKSKAPDKKKEEEDDDEEKDGDDEETKAAKKARKAKKAEEAEKAKKEAEKSTGDELGKKDYSDKEREEMADKKEALPDGSFPIKTKKDLENAIHAYGRAKDKPKAKAHIEARAKALDAEDALPDGWDEDEGKKSEKSAAGDLKKGMYGVARLADLLQTLDYLQQCSEREEKGEGDDSTVPAKLKAALSSLGDILKQMTGEEVDELLSGDDDEMPCILLMSAKSGELGKRGAKISAESKDHIDKMMKSAQDHLDEMGKCYKALGMGEEEDGAAKSAPTGELKKAAAENDALKKVLGDMTPKLEAVLNTVESLKGEKEQLAKRIEHLEGQPLPARGMLRAVNKGGDNGGNDTDGDIVRKFNDHMASLPQEDQSKLLMKFALANPVKVTS